MDQDGESRNEAAHSHSDIQMESDNNCSDVCYDMDEEDDYVYDDDDDQYSYHPEDDDDDYGDDNSNLSDSQMDMNGNGEPHQSIRMSSTSELSSTLSQRISKICTLHNLGPSVAHALLRHYRWNDERLTDALLTDPPAAFTAAGVSARQSSSSSQQSAKTTTATTPADVAAGACPICFTDDEPLRQMPCGHSFCLDCWGGFLREAVGQGHLSCFTKSCPAFKCTEVITEDEITAFAPELEAEYRTLQLRAFADEDNGCRWCPSPGCDRIAVWGGGGGGGGWGGRAMVITCDGQDCGLSFCVRCAQEPHAPAKCHELELWMEKDSDQSLTMDWVLLNTKKCKGCGKRIEKNQGCNHMTCKCGYEFCWICGRDWKVRGYDHNCNQFVEGEGETWTDKKDGDKEKELDKYLHYYKRYVAHDRAQKFADKQLSEIVNRTDTRLADYIKENNGISYSDLDFLKDANKQLVDCRRTLKFTYIFAYYMKDRGLITKDYADLKIGGGGGKAGKRQLSVGSNSSLGTKKVARQLSNSDLSSSTGRGIVRQRSNRSDHSSSTGRGVARQWSNTSDRSSSTGRGMSIGISRGISRGISDSSAIEKFVGKKQKEQFENHQRLLEMFTDELSELVEKPVGLIIRSEVDNKTKIIANYVRNIIAYTEEQF